MATISLCMIVKNEEAVLSRCLESVKELVDEIIIVDTGSTDETKEIAQEYTNSIYDFKWIDDFSAARNYAFSKAKMDYIFWLDADDVVLEEDRKKFMALKGHLDSSIDAVSMHYNLAFNSEGDVTFSNRRNRLVKRSNHFKWYGAVHEYLEVGGNIIYSDICITHKSSKTSLSDRNLRIYENMLKRGVTFTPRDLYYYANECYDHQLFERAIEYYNNFLDTNQGWSEDCINACAKIADIFIESDDMEEAIPYILKSFTYDLPRADQCCRLGYIYLSKKDLEKAIFWYDLATKLDVKRVEKIGGFINHACYTWLPHLQLCVCYDLLGNYKSAFYHNEMARKYNPSNSSIIYNKSYLETKIKELGGHHAN